MAHAPAALVLRHIRGLAAAPADQLSDRELLDRFTARHEQTAFESLLRRHGPLVLGVCRRVLHNEHDAEDAFQATFLVLARKATSAGRHGSLGGWLHRVAYRAAVKARARANRRPGERRAEPGTTADPLAEVTGRELLAALDEELQQLPERWRGPLVLCYLEGHPRDEAARRLGCSLRTLQRRLDEARERLGRRLVRRGLALSAALLATGSLQGTVLAVPSLLTAATVQVASGKATAAAPIAALTEEVLGAFAAAKVKPAAALLLALALLLPGAALLTLPQAHGLQPPGLDQAEARERPEVKPPAAPAQPRAEGQRMTVTGRVLDPDGKPVANARVAVLTWPIDPLHARAEPEGMRRAGQGGVGPDGRFQLDLPRLSSGRHYLARLVASAPGFGVGWEAFGPDAERPDLTVRLAREQVLRGRLVDLQGAPAAKVKVHVQGISRNRSDACSEPAGDVPAWPEPVTTDEQGHFTLRGLGAGYDLGLVVRDARFAPELLTVASDHKDRAGEVTLTLSPPQVLTGRVTYADTGKPAAGARLKAMGSAGNHYGTTGTDGRYTMPVAAAGLQLSATAPEGEPYLTLKRFVSWPKGAARHAEDLEVPRGVLVTGTVTEAPSGRPVAAASIQFFPRMTDNPDLRKDVATLWRGGAVTGPDGAFRLAVPPGPGHLLVAGPTPDYVHREALFGVLALGAPRFGSYQAGPEGNAYYGGQRLYAHAVVPVKHNAGDRPEALQLTLRRGVTVSGRLLGADGKPVAKARMLSRLQVYPYEHLVRMPVDVYDGRFTLSGCDPEQTYRVIFFEAAGKQGTVVDIAGKQAGGEPVTVRLQPCGRATARLLYRDGQPVRKRTLNVELVVTPGAAGMDAKGPMADLVWIQVADPVHYQDGPTSDHQGRITLPVVIPGVTYRIHLQNGAKNITAATGEADWGDIVDPVLFAESD